MRIILFTGKGGVGKTSVAAGTAVAASKRGLRTLVTSTDPAHSLSDSFDLEIGQEPTEITPDLFGQQIDSQRRLEDSWRDIRDYAIDVLSWTGMSGIHAEELSVIPGLDEIFGLAEIKTHHDSGQWDLLVVDCAPTAETLRLLSLPEIMSWYIERIFPVERKIVKTVRPVMKKMRGLPPMASDAFYGAVERFYRKLEGVRDILVDPTTTSIRLVMNAEKMVISEAQRTYTYLALFGYRVDCVVVNRLIPDEINDPYFERWKELQANHLEEINASFEPVPILKARLFDREMTGLGLLEELAQEVYRDLDPSKVLWDDDTIKVSRQPNGHTLRIRLPFTNKGDVDLSRKGDELHVKVGTAKRNVALPLALQSEAVKGASFEGDWLSIRFEAVEQPSQAVGTRS